MFKQAAAAAGDTRSEIKQRLLRRLAWKVPLIVLLVTFAVWWEWRRESAVPEKAQTAALSGVWSGEVTYGSGGKYTERFFFQIEGDKLFGTAEFSGHKRGIEEGTVAGGEFSFFIRVPGVSGEPTRERTYHYRGTLQGRKIFIRMQDDRGNLPLEAVLARSAAVP